LTLLLVTLVFSSILRQDGSPLLPDAVRDIHSTVYTQRGTRHLQPPNTFSGLYVNTPKMRLRPSDCHKRIFRCI